MRFRPTLWATLAAVPALAVLIGLGVWQLQRLDWKTGLIALRAERVVSPVIDLVPRTRSDRIVDPGRFEARLPPATSLAVLTEDPAAFEYRPIRLAGTLQHDRAVHLYGRTRDGAPGVDVITPLTLGQGGIVFVNRGWVSLRDPASKKTFSRPEGRVVIEGHVRLFTEPGLFTPDNDPGSDLWYWADPAALADRVGGNAVTVFYVQAAPAEKDVYPIGGVPEIALRNPHLQYALTWFGIAAALVGIYVAFHIRRQENGDE